MEEQFKPLEEETASQTNTQEAPTGTEHNTGMAVVAYILFFIPLLTDAKNDPFVKFHVKQGLLIFIAMVVASVLSITPVFMMFAWILHIAILVLAVIGIMNALAGKQEPLPLIGQFADRFHF